VPTLTAMFGRQTVGSTVCPSCGRLVGVRDAACFSCGARNPALFGFGPALRRLGGDFAFPNLLLAGCATLYVVSLLLSPGALQPRGLMSLLSPSWPALFLLGGSGAEPIFGYGRWWTVLSAGWLHGGLLHIGFNLMWVRDLAPAVAKLYGSGRLVLIYVAGGIGGFLLTSVVAYYAPGLPYFLHGGMRTIGASAPLFGLFGALVCYSQRTGQSGLRRMVWTWVAIGVVFGVVVPGVDNWAHAGGFAAGWLVARGLDPLREERPGHVALALVALAASLLAIVASVITALPLVRG
jgi:rhomboid protease GluP